MSSAVISRLARAGLRRFVGPSNYREFVEGLAVDAGLQSWIARGTLYKFANTDVDEYRAKFGKAEGERRFFAENRPDSVVPAGRNLLSIGGASCLFEALIGNGTGTSAQTLTYFNHANTYIGVGDNSTAAAATQTDLQASTNKVRNAADTSYPLHTDGATAATITGATNASPISITATAHGFSTGDVVVISGIGGNTAGNGTFQITVVDANTFTLNNSTGNGAYTSGGIANKPQCLVIQSTFGNSVGNFNWNEWAIFNGSTGGRMLNRSQIALGTKVSTATWTLLVAISLQ